MSDVEDVISDNEEVDDLFAEPSQRDEEEDYEAPVQDEERKQEDNESMDGGEETGHTQEEEELQAVHIGMMMMQWATHNTIICGSYQECRL